MKKIIVIGAGYAGVLTTKRLAKKLKKHEDVEITIFNRESYHTMLTELHEVAAGRVDEESIRLQLSDIFAHRNVNVIIEEVDTIDFDNKKINTFDGNSHDYDYLVIGTGCRPTYFGLEGYENTFPLWSYKDAVRLKTQINEMFRLACEEKNEQERKKLLSFVIVGSGFTGVEMAGELGEYKDELCKKYDIKPAEVSIQIIEMNDKILPFYPEDLVEKIVKRLNKLGVEVLTNQSVCNVNTKTCTLSTEKMLDTHTVIWTAGIEGSELVSKLEGVSKLGRGRIQTNKYLESEEYSDVYIVGDNIFYIPEGSEAPVPQMVENAEHSSDVVAHNLVAKINGSEQEEYNPVFKGSMVCVGSRWGAAHIGSKRKISLTGIPAMFVKHFVNAIYFMQVLGLNKIWNYGLHEIFEVKNNRSLFGGHFSNHKSAPGFFLVPLRLFIGFMWLTSGLVKLPMIMDDPSNVFLMPPNPIDVAAAPASETSETEETDATGAATGETEEVAVEEDAESSATGETEEVVVEEDAESSATGETEEEYKEESEETFDARMEELAGYTELYAGQALPVPEVIENMMNQTFEWFFWSDEGGFTFFAQAVQFMMVISEIVIGVMLIFGFLTPVAAVIGAALMAIIYMSGWSYISIVFFGLSSIACVFSGNSFGVDYYFLPWLNGKLHKWKFTRKWYMYFKHE